MSAPEPAPPREPGLARQAGPAEEPGGFADAALASVLAEIFTTAGERDSAVLKRAHAVTAGWAESPTPAQASELCAEAALPVRPEVGRLLYLLVRMLRPGRVVEFGTSFGASILYLAAALRDNGAGEVIGSELHPGKADRARRNLARAGLQNWARVLVGDAREELATLDGPVDLVLLDGWKDLYLPVLRILEPRLRAGAVIISDNQPMLEASFLDHVRDPDNGYLSLPLPVGEGIEWSVRIAGVAC